jgi:hypothetical protein
MTEQSLVEILHVRWICTSNLLKACNSRYMGADDFTWLSVFVLKHVLGSFVAISGERKSIDEVTHSRGEQLLQVRELAGLRETFGGIDLGEERTPKPHEVENVPIEFSHFDLGQFARMRRGGAAAPRRECS